jgi:hypothetical protein
MTIAVPAYGYEPGSDSVDQEGFMLKSACCCATKYYYFFKRVVSDLMMDRNIS